MLNKSSFICYEIKNVPTSYDPSHKHLLTMWPTSNYLHTFAALEIKSSGHPYL